MHPLVFLLLALCVGCATAGHVVELLDMAQVHKDGFNLLMSYSDGLKDKNICFNDGPFTIDLVQLRKGQVTNTIARVSYTTQQGRYFVLQLVKMNWPSRVPSIDVAMDSIKPVTNNPDTTKLSVTYFKASTYIRKEYIWTSNQGKSGYIGQPAKELDLSNN